MNKILQAVGVTTWLLTACTAIGCSAGYESDVVLARSARLIIGVKIKAVMDAVYDRKDYYDRTRLYQDPDHNRGENGQARVEVTEIVRGSCKIDKFNLVGGPYATCGPFYPYYMKFEKGKSIYLLLDRPLPDDTKNVIINWRCRIFKGSRAELDDLLKRTDDQRLRMLERHRKLFPDAMAEAESLLPKAQIENTQKPSADTSYPLLSCLRLLLSDPANFRPSEFTYEDEAMTAYRFNRKQPEGTYTTACSTDPWQYQSLDNALNARATSHPEEVIDFNRRLLNEYLVSETGVNEALANKISNDESIIPILSELQESPFTFTLDLKPLYRKEPLDFSRLILSASFLLMMADEADDCIEWHFYGLSPGDPPDLDAELFLRMVEQNPNRFTEKWPGRNLLLAMPHPRLAPTVKKIMFQIMHESDDYSRLPEFFDYFAIIGDENTCLELLTNFERLNTEKLAALKEPKDRKVLIENTGDIPQKFTQAAEKHHLRSEAIQAALKRSSELYTPKPENKVPDSDNDPFENSLK